MTNTRNVVGLVGDLVVLTQDVGRGAFAARKGERTEIVGFERTAYGRTHNHGLPPGIYHNPAYPIVRTALGREVTIGRHVLEPADGGEGRTIGRGDLRVSDLPDAPFWETDVVRTRDGQEMQVVSVDHLAIAGEGRSSGRPFRCMDGEGVTIEMEGMALTLVARGPVWRRAHGETLDFDTAEDSAAFHQAVGEYDEVRNPGTGTFAWDLERASESLSAGEVDGFLGAFPTRTTGLHVIRYRDPAVGEAVRNDTLERIGPSRSPAP